MKESVLQIHREIKIKAELLARSIHLETLPSGVIIADDMVYFPSFPGSGLVVPYQMFLGVLDKIEASYSFWVHVLSMDKAPSRVRG